MSEDSSLRRIASRRFVVIILALLISTMLRYNNLIPPESFQTIVIWLSGIYVIGKPVGDQLGMFLGKRL